MVRTTPTADQSPAEAVIARCAAAAGPHAEELQVAVGDEGFTVRGPADLIEACDRFDVFSASAPSQHSGRIIHVACGDAVAADLPAATLTVPRDERRPVALGEVVVAVRADPLILYAVSADRRRGAVWFPSAEQRPQWEHARPLLPVLQAMLRDTPWTVLHAAAIGRGDRAFLLAGASRAGKTSLSLRALVEGWDFYGDDVVAVATTDGLPPRVARVYDTARLRMPALAGLERLADSGIESRDDGEVRRELRVRPFVADRRWSAQITDLLFVDRKGVAVPTFRPVSRTQVVSTLTATTLQVSFGDMAHRAAAVDLCSRLAPRGFDPGPDVSAALRALGSSGDHDG